MKKGNNNDIKKEKENLDEHEKRKTRKKKKNLLFPSIPESKWKKKGVSSFLLLEYFWNL